MISICAPEPVHLDLAYALFCSHRETPWSMALFQHSLQTPFSCIALSDTALLGFIVVSHVLDEAEIEDVCVDARYRRHGVAKRLLLQVISRLKDANIVRLHLEVRQSNQAAITLYESMGFIKIGERKQYYERINDVSESALLYCLDVLKINAER